MKGGDRPDRAAPPAYSRFRLVHLRSQAAVDHAVIPRRLRQRPRWTPTIQAAYNGLVLQNCIAAKSEIRWASPNWVRSAKKWKIIASFIKLNCSQRPAHPALLIFSHLTVQW